MLRTIEMYTNKYKDTTQKEIRKKKEKKTRNYRVIKLKNKNY